MPKNFLKKHLPSPSEMRKKKGLGFLGERIYAQNLWHLNRHSVSRAVFIGIFCGFLPLPIQMLLAGTLSVFFCANIPLSIVLVWISNPLTWVPMFYATYRFGAWILGTSPIDNFTIELSIDWVMNTFDLILQIWQPLMLGSVIAGLFFSFLGYFTIKLIWRYSIIRSWKNRSAKRTKNSKS
ncbi:MAG: DUF2062 domain-containing protein [Gammaproteobacteria bacterium]|nr:MAG: DUF2062 domain-containing protein [Gammaproteobacteria bacterium]